MTKTTSVMRLDFITIRPHFTPKLLFLYGFLTIFLSLSSGNVMSGVGIGLMLGMLFTSYPFAVSEKSNTDALYAILSIRRKKLVAGRYLLILVLDLCTAAFSYILATLSVFIGRELNLGESSSGDTTQGFILLAAGFFLIQLAQLPIYFRFGYTKAKFMSIIPLLCMIPVYGMIRAIHQDDAAPLLSFDLNAQLEAHWPAAAIGLCLLIFLSYRLSVTFYRKREF